MPPDRDAKTEAPTPRRRQEAREKGQVARSQDLPAAVLLLGTVVAFKVLGPKIWGSLRDLYEAVLGNEACHAQPVCDLVVLSLRPVAWIVLPILLLGALFVLVANLAQVGWLIAPNQVMPDLNRINPINGFGRLFDMQALVRLGMGLLKMASVAGVAALTLWQMHAGVMYAANLGTELLIGYTGEVVYTLCLRLAIVLLILAIVDYAWQRWRLEQDLKMTKEELKEEFRRMEGDPVIKQRRRHVQMQLAMHRMRYDVPKADVVITNPTHLAIAIKYDAETMSAPKVLAKGQGYMAQKIREIALEHGIPIVERRPLAQALYKAAEVGAEIPREFYRAIAEVLAYVYELSGRGFRRKPVKV